MSFAESKNDSDDTMCSQEITCFDTDYRRFFETLKHKIWLHMNKEDFFKKSSIDHYLHALSKIESNDQALNTAIETYARQLQFLKLEMEAYEETIKSLHNTPIDFDNLTEDQEMLKNIRFPNNSEEWDVLKQTQLAESASVANISESLFTNNDFNYSSSKIFDSEKTLAEIDNSRIDNDAKYLLPEQEEASGIDISYNCIRNPPKKRKFDEANLLGITKEEILQNFDMEDILAVKAIISMVKLDNKEANPAEQIGNSSIEALELDELPDMSNPKYTVFDDHEVIQRYLGRMKELIKSFQAYFGEEMDKLSEAEKNEKKVTMEGKSKEVFNPFFYKPGDSIPTPPIEEKTEKQMPNLTLEQLSVIFSEMYKNLSDKDDDDDE
ncbi:hypothetical protein Trydic_g3679 [Trypoxylus dichotomus]